MREAFRVEHGGVGGQVVECGDGYAPDALPGDAPLGARADEGFKAVARCARLVHIEWAYKAVLTDVGEERHVLQSSDSVLLDVVQVRKPLRGRPIESVKA